MTDKFNVILESLPATEPAVILFGGLTAFPNWFATRWRPSCRSSLSMLSVLAAGSDFLNGAIPLKAYFWKSAYMALAMGCTSGRKEATKVSTVSEARESTNAFSRFLLLVLPHHQRSKSAIAT